MKLQYISNLDVTSKSGGWHGMNYNIYHGLDKSFDIYTTDNINPKLFFFEVWLSKIMRGIGLKGIFPAFSRKRLRKISTLVKPKLENDADIIFFHGATPWLNICTSKPYCVFLDACFYTYINVYQDSRIFSTKQLSRLYKNEASFIRNAKAVFFTSNWAMQECINTYHLEDKNMHIALPGTEVQFSESNYNIENPYLLFIGLDFIGKGGLLVVESFQKLKESIPKLKLYIVGQKPPQFVCDISGVAYVGFLDKSKKEENNKLISLFTGAICFVLPTKKDMTPLVLLEAMSSSCPVVSSNYYGITEMLDNGKAGILLKNLTISDICTSIEFLMTTENRFVLMTNAKKNVEEKYNWNRTISKIVNEIKIK